MELSTFWQVEHHASGSLVKWSIAGLLFVSFVPLFEFGRRMTSKFKEYSAIWLYAVLLLSILAVSKVANEPQLGFVTATRVFVGFPAALLTGWVFWRESRIKQDDSPKVFPLLAAAFYIYGLSTIVMPAADPNLPALFLTQEQFMSFFNFPVQVLRACCAVVAAISIVFIVRRLNYESALNEVRQMQKIVQLHGVEHLNEILVKQAEERRQLEEQIRVMAAAFETQESVIITDAEGVILRVNQAFIESTGYTAEEAIGQTPRLLKSGRHDAEFYREMWETIGRAGVWRGEIWDKRKNGKVLPELLTISAVKNEDGAVTHYVGAYINITERKAAEEEVKNLAFSDTLTNLPNRRLLNDRLEQAMAASKRSGCYGALMFLDLDNFKPLNDAHGHDIGDLLLVEVARRISSCAREVDTVARFGGDEFMILIGELNSGKAESAAQAEVVAERIRALLSEPYMLKFKSNGKAEKTVEHFCSASIGVALFLNHEGSAEDIVKWADMAMYQAKEAGRNSIRFHEEQV